MANKNLITETFVSFETAKLARKKGLIYGVQCHAIYHIGFKDLEEKRGLKYISKNSVENQFHLALAPTHEALQKWLRINHNIDVYVIGWSKHVANSFNHKRYEGCVNNIKEDDCLWSDYFDDYPNAMENALYKSLSYLYDYCYWMV